MEARQRLAAKCLVFGVTKTPIATIAAIVAHWCDSPGWMFWGTIAVGVFTWLCWHAVKNAKDDLLTGRESDRRVLKYWFVITSVMIPIKWGLCITTIAVSVFLRTVAL